MFVNKYLPYNVVSSSLLPQQQNESVRKCVYLYLCIFIPMQNKSFPYLFIYFIYLLNFNYTDLNIQIVNKLTFKMNEKLQKLQKLQDLNN